MTKTRYTLIALFAAAVALPLGANATEDRSSGTLGVNTTVSSDYQFGLQHCPPGTPSTTTDCVRFSGPAGIPGLGRATVTYVKSFDETICPGQVTGAKTTLFDVAGKGQIKVAMDYPSCVDRAPNSTVVRGTIAEGTGAFAGASGSLQIASMVYAPSCDQSGCVGSSTDTWTGNLSVPGLEFDLTPPVFQPVASKRVKAPRKAKTVRVRYSPKAQDAVDGPVPVTCNPRSGSRFKVGRTTRVSCSAEDSSANVATTSFKVKVTRRSR
jgi:HYR domain-containing protein